MNTEFEFIFSSRGVRSTSRQFCRTIADEPRWTPTSFPIKLWSIAIYVDKDRFRPDILGFWPRWTTINTDKHRRSRFSGTINYDKHRYIRMNQDKLGFWSTYQDFGADFESYYINSATFHFESFLVQTSHCQHASADYTWRRTHLDPALHAGRDRHEGDCSSPGPAAAERPDVFQPQIQEVQTLHGLGRSQDKIGRRKANITNFRGASCQLPTGSPSSTTTECLLICSTRSWTNSHN